MDMDMAKCWQLDFFVFPPPPLLAAIVVVDAWQLCRNYKAAHGNAVAILWLLITPQRESAKERKEESDRQRVCVWDWVSGRVCMCVCGADSVAKQS